MSPCLTVIFSIGMSRCSLASIAQAVACPWPCGEVPVSTVTVPSGCTSTAALSLNAAAAGDLDEHRDADADLHRVAALAPGGLLGPQVGVTGRVEHRVERLLVLAGVVGRAALGGERELVGAQEVAAAHLGRVHADLGGEQVHRPLDGRRGLGASGAAVGRDRRRVGDEHAGPRLHPLDVVHGGRHHAREHRQHGAEAGVGARVLEDVEAVGADVAVAVAADRDRLPLGAALHHPGHVLRAGLAHRTGRPTCLASQATSANSGSAPILAPKPPPTSGVITRSCSASMPSQPATSLAGVLRVLVEHQRVSRPSSPHAAAAARVSSGAAASRWLTISRVTTTSQPSKRSVGVRLAVEAVGGVGARLGEEQHLVGGGGLEVDDDRQRVVVDLDQVGGVLPLVGLLGEDGGHRLADEPHHVLRQERAHHLLVGPAEQQRGLEVDVGAGEDADHAGRRTGLPDVDRLDAGVCEWGPDEREMQRSDQVEVVGVAGAAREESRILHAHDARAHDAHRSGA